MRASDLRVNMPLIPDFFKQSAIGSKVKKVDLRTYICFRNNPDIVRSTLIKETQLKTLDEDSVWLKQQVI